MKHLRRFNEEIKPEREFLVVDKTGRGAKAKLDKGDIEQTWDISEEDDNDLTLAEFLDEAEMGDTWETRTVKITCI